MRTKKNGAGVPIKISARQPARDQDPVITTGLRRHPHGLRQRSHEHRRVQLKDDKNNGPDMPQDGLYLSAHTALRAEAYLD